MSQKDFEAAHNRLKQAVQDVQWVLSVLDEPSSNIKDYNLTPVEKSKFLQEAHTLMADIHVLQAQTLLKRVNVRVKNKEVQVVGPVPHWIDVSETDHITTAVPPIPRYDTRTKGGKHRTE